MVRFENDKFVIECYTGACPIENWLELINELTMLLSAHTDGTPNDFWLVSSFINDLMPDIDTALKMRQRKDEITPFNAAK